ncbi:MAG: peptidoglycan recognition family protein, partial [Planctomycetota bacterium]
WQGAHVKHQNEHNVGILCLGNFDRQRPTEAQLTGLATHLQRLVSRYRLPMRHVHTHQELAATACPGLNLQPQLVAMRTNGSIRA